MASPRIVLAEYFVSDHATFIFIVRNDFEHPRKEEVLYKRSDLLQFLRTYFAGKGIHDELCHLDLDMWEAESALLTEPLLRWADPGDILYIVPHGLLHYLPLHATVHDGQYLIERNPVVYTPSASILRYSQRNRKERRETCLVFADPNGDLPYARIEGQAVAELFGTNARLFLGEEATKATLIQQLEEMEGDIGFLHLACHGLFDFRRPMCSGIKFHAGILTAEEILRLQLRSDLITVSACDSGLNEVRPGDELIGLTRAFLLAGACSLLVSLWKVDDQVASDLMVSFYSRLLKDGNQSKVEALQGAQVEVMRQTRNDLATPWTPYYWASFILVGDWK